MSKKRTTKSKEDSVKARRWVFVWNNYTTAHIEQLLGLTSDQVDYLIAGFEVGENGTPHIQGYAEFSSPIQRSTVKARLDPILKHKSGVHVEACKGTRDENIVYVRKPETKDPNKVNEDGTPLFIEISHKVKKQGERTDWHEIYECLEAKPDFDEFAKEHPETAIKYHGGVEKVIRGIKHKQMITEVKASFDACTLRRWQQKLLTDVSYKPHDRKVIWFYDKTGNCGKTWLSKLLHVKYDAAYFNNCKTADISYAYNGEKIIIFDFARSSEERINYDVIERCKNGMLFSSKYESRTKIFEVPHVIIMANFEPDRSKLSQDRWDVRVLTEADNTVDTVEDAQITLPWGNTGLIGPDPWQIVDAREKELAAQKDAIEAELLKVADLKCEILGLNNI